MKLDKSKLEALSSLSDEQLWAEIRSIAGSHGFSLPEAQPSREDLGKIRAALSDSEKLNLSGAIRILNNYKRGKK
ncbi:MAG: hypothetical protein E7617_06575 [Ruminococcaceae bacterium]|nr:hypothetical protein [Oscillospiraceae bacterium]